MPQRAARVRADGVSLVGRCIRRSALAIQHEARTERPPAAPQSNGTDSSGSESHVVWRIDAANAGTPTTGGAAGEGTHPFGEFGISLFRVRAPSYISSCVHFKIPIIVGTAGGLPQTFGHSSRGTLLRSVAPLVVSSRQEVPVMRALFDRVAISLNTVQMLIGSRQDVFRHATDACPCSRGLVPSVWAQQACSNR